MHLLDYYRRRFEKTLVDVLDNSKEYSREDLERICRERSYNGDDNIEMLITAYEALHLAENKALQKAQATR